MVAKRDKQLSLLGMYTGGTFTDFVLLSKEGVAIH